MPPFEEVRLVIAAILQSGRIPSVPQRDAPRAGLISFRTTHTLACAGRALAAQLLRMAPIAGLSETRVRGGTRRGVTV